MSTESRWNNLVDTDDTFSLLYHGNNVKVDSLVIDLLHVVKHEVNQHKHWKRTCSNIDFNDPLRRFASILTIVVTVLQEHSKWICYSINSNIIL